MTQTTANNEFLRELKDLFNKHGKVIDSCGCCCSPWVKETMNEVVDIDCTDDGEFLDYTYKEKEEVS